MSTNISTTGTLSSVGIGSGLDVTTIISGLMKVEQAPLTDLKTAATGINTTISSFGELKSAISTFRDAAAALALPSAFSATTGSSSDPTSVTLTTTASAAPGNYSVEVSALAASQSTVSGTFGSSSARVGAGTLHIDIGSWASDDSAFTAKKDAGGTDIPAVDVAVTATDTLDTVAGKINSANAGITASVVNDSSGSRLVFSATTSGLANAFRVTATDSGDGDGGVDAAHLSALAYDPADGTSATTRTQKPGDATAKINGLSVTSATNTLTNVLSGISLTLGKITTGPVQVGVAQDNSNITKSVQTFVDSYNALSTLLATDLKYDLGSKASGPLQGDSTARSLQSQLRNILGSSSGASSVFSTLSQVGLQKASDGTLSLDSTKFTSALANPVEVKKLFTNVDRANAGNAGFANQLRGFGDQVLGVNGILTTRVAGLKTKLANNTKNQGTLQDRLDSTQARLKAQYSALDTKISSISSLGTYVNQQITNWNKNGA